MSVIDLPLPTLNPSVWDCGGNNAVQDCRVKEGVRRSILDLLYYFLETTLGELPDNLIQGVYLTGSMATYQWSSSSDIDITVVLNPAYYDTFSRDVVVKRLPELNGKLQIDGYPVNFYFTFVFTPSSYDAVYDLIQNVWVKKPKKIEPFDPRIRFLKTWIDIESWMEDVDISVMRVRRNLIDYNKINQILNSLPDESYPLLEKMLRARLEQVNRDIQNLIDRYNEIHEERKLSYQNLLRRMRPEDVLSAAWLPEDIRYKFLERYKYNELLRALKRRWGYSVVDEESVNELAEILENFFRISSVIPKTHLLRFAFVREGEKKYKYPFRIWRKKRRMPVRRPPSFVQTEETMAQELMVSEMEGFNTLYEVRPVPRRYDDLLNSPGPQSVEPWNQIEKTYGSLLKIAQDEQQPQNQQPPENQENPPEQSEQQTEQQSPPPSNRVPVEQELRQILQPDSQPSTPPTKPPTGQPISTTVPDVVRSFSDYDAWLYYALEKQRADAINRGDVAKLRQINRQIEQLLNKYFNPIPAPKPAVDSTNVAASVKLIYPNIQFPLERSLDEAVEAVVKFLVDHGIPYKMVRLGYRGEGKIEFIVDVIRDYPPFAGQENLQVMVYEEPFVPMVVIYDTENQYVVPKLFKLDGTPVDPSEVVRQVFF